MQNSPIQKIMFCIRLSMDNVSHKMALNQDRPMKVEARSLLNLTMTSGSWHNLDQKHHPQNTIETLDH